MSTYLGKFSTKTPWEKIIVNRFFDKKCPLTGEMEVYVRGDLVSKNGDIYRGATFPRSLLDEHYQQVMLPRKNCRKAGPASEPEQGITRESDDLEYQSRVAEMKKLIDKK